MWSYHYVIDKNSYDWTQNETFQHCPDKYYLILVPYSNDLGLFYLNIVLYWHSDNPGYVAKLVTHCFVSTRVILIALYCIVFIDLKINNLYIINQ